MVRNFEGPELDDADLYYLPKDLGETADLSASEPERKAQLFAAYRAYFTDAPLKPLALEFLANKDSKKKPAPKSPAPAKKKPAIPDQESDAERKATYQARRAALLKQQAALLSEEQKASSEAAREQAIAEGKKGVALRKAIDAGANLTEDQIRQLVRLRQELGRLTRDYRQPLKDPPSGKE